MFVHDDIMLFNHECLRTQIRMHRERRYHQTLGFVFFTLFLQVFVHIDKVSLEPSLLTAKQSQFSAFPHRRYSSPSAIDGPSLDSLHNVSCTGKVLVSLGNCCLTFSQPCFHSALMELLINEVPSDSRISNILETFLTNLLHI